ncbi:MAG: hypothetical protein SFX73_01585 [Kofleriaceae bacterium]|nr:hypothetical protein [Kofleriaceae bacterium]
MTRLANGSRWRSLALMLLTACNGGGQSGDDDPGPGPGPDARVQEPLINGMPASQFYGQFAHATTMTAVSGAAAFPQTGDRNAFLTHFFLMPNGEHELFYAEGDGDVGLDGWSLSVDTTTMKRKSGTWKVEGSKLVLGTWMSCDGMELNGAPALRCTLTSAIVTAAAQGRSGIWEKAFGMKSPDDSEWTDYQP